MGILSWVFSNTKVQNNFIQKFGIIFILFLMNVVFQKSGFCDTNAPISGNTTQPTFNGPGYLAKKYHNAKIDSHQAAIKKMQTQNLQATKALKNKEAQMQKLSKQNKTDGKQFRKLLSDHVDLRQKINANSNSIKAKASQIESHQKSLYGSQHSDVEGKARNTSTYGTNSGNAIQAQHTYNGGDISQFKNPPTIKQVGQANRFSNSASSNSATSYNTMNQPASVTRQPSMSQQVSVTRQEEDSVERVNTRSSSISGSNGQSQVNQSQMNMMNLQNVVQQMGQAGQNIQQQQQTNSQNSSQSQATFQQSQQAAAAAQAAQTSQNLQAAQQLQQQLQQQPQQQQPQQPGGSSQ